MAQFMGDVAPLLELGHVAAELEQHNLESTTAS